MSNPRKSSRKAPPGAQKPVTLKDVAAKAGVSTATVSYVLSGLARRQQISPQTEEKIRKTVEALGYQGNTLARQLRMGKTRTIGVLVPWLAHTITALLAHELQQVLREAGYDMVLGDSGNQVAHQDDLLRNFLSRPMDGLMLFPVPGTDPGKVRDLVAPGIKLLVGDRETFSDFPCVALDRSGGIRELGRHFAALDLPEVLYVSSRLSHADGSIKMASFNEGLAAGGKPPARLLAGEATAFELGEWAAGEISKMERVRRGIFCYSDESAIALVHGLRRQGLSCPQEVVVAGFNDIPLARYCLTPITTVRFPYEALARAMARRMLSMLDGGPETAEEKETIGVDLIFRESCPRGAR